MRRGTIATVSAATLVALTLASGAVARADPAARLVYDAPAACPDAAAFAAAVHERAPHAVLAADGPRVFAVAIAATADGFTGSLTAPDSAAPRSLGAARCDDLVAALALVTALAIDPTALADPPAPQPPAPPPKPPAPPPRPPAPLPRPPAPAPRPSRDDAAIFVAPELDDGVARDVLPAIDLEGRYIRRGVGHADLGVVLGRDTATTSAGRARFTWLVARAGLCWTAHDGRFAADACAHLDAGMLEAAGVDVVRAQDLRRSWLDAGAHVAARWRATANVFAELRAGASAPFERDRFYFEPMVLVHQAAPVTPWIDLGVGVRFW